MYSLTIAIGPTMWSLLFHNEENAKKQEAAITTGMHTLTQFGVQDDFGQKLQAMPASVHGWMLENLDETKMAHCERMLHQTRTHNQAQRMAESDPALRMSAQMRGPAMISPMGANGR